MLRRWIAILATTWLTAWCGSCAAHGQITQLSCIEELPLIHVNGTVFFFDLEDTLIDAPHMLGSKAWRAYVAEASGGLAAPWHDLLTLYVAHRCHAVAREPSTASVIAELQSRGHAVFGVTSRRRDRWGATPAKGVDALTVRQLEAAGITLHGQPAAERYPALTQDPIYYEGVIFADTPHKGDCLKRLLHQCMDSGQAPAKVVFVDDRLPQINACTKALRELGLDYEGYWYRAGAENDRLFDPLVANLQLYALIQGFSYHPLSDEEAARLAWQLPARSPAYYLEQLVRTPDRWRAALKDYLEER